MPIEWCVRGASVLLGGRSAFWRWCWLVVGVALFGGTGCSVTKNVGEDEYLLDKMRIEAQGLPSDISQSEFRRYVRQRPNGRVLGGRFHLWLYNLGAKGKDRGISGWLHRIGEPPVIYSPVLTAQSVENLETYLHSRGFYAAIVRDTSYSKRAKRMCVRYDIDFGLPTLIDTLRLDIEDTLVRSLVTASMAESELHMGDRLDTRALDAERARIEGVLRDEGFFNFTSDDVSFVADTIGNALRARVTLTIPPPGTAESAQNAFRRYYVDSVRIYTKYDPLRPSSGQRDSLSHDEDGGLHYYYPEKPGIRFPVIEHLVLFRQDSLIRISQVNKSQSNLLGLGLYQNASFEFRESLRSRDTVSDEGGRALFPLNADLRLTRFPVQGYSFEALLTTSGDLGMEGSFTYRHRNFFLGSELLEVRFQAQVDAIRNRDAFKFRSALELGARVGLTFPRFLLPFVGNEFVSRYAPSTRFALSYNYQRRPDYTRTLASASFSYSWSGSPAITHNVVPTEVSVVQIFSIDPAFAERIHRTYLAHSYMSQIVTLSSYSFSYSDLPDPMRRGSSSVRFNLEFSGNAYWGLARWLAVPDSTGVYSIFGLPFSQYARADVNYVYRLNLDRFNTMAFRVFAGAGYPYGNSRALPFGKKYYQGGANGIRAWHARDLGPGSYHEEGMVFPNQTADMKLELNWEYRFKLFWKLESALFLDAGNIWAITGADEREGAVFDVRRFYREIALGYGTGLRLNLGFFILRVDLGVKLFDPAGEKTGGRKGVWIPIDRRYRGRDFVVHFGVGYPF